MSQNNGTAMTSKPSYFDCFAIYNDDTLTIISPNRGKKWVINYAVVQNVWTDADRELLESIENKGLPEREYGVRLTYPQLESLASIAKRSAEAQITPVTPPPAIKVETPTAPVVTNNGPTTTIVTPPAAQTLSSLAGCTTTVTGPAVPGERKKRQRKTDSTVLEMYEDIRRYSRAYGVDELERKIRALQNAERFVGQKLKQFNYDIPTAIRAEIVEPSAVVWCHGIMPTESQGLLTEERVQSESFQRFLSILNRYGKGTENAARLGCFVKYRICGVAYEDEKELRELVSEALSELLIKAHTSLIQGLANADKAFKEAMEQENLTSKDQERIHCTLDNAYRAKIRAAAEDLNLAVARAEQYDHTADVRDLMEGLRAVISSQAASFNAKMRLKDGRRVDI